MDARLNQIIHNPQRPGAFDRASSQVGEGLFYSQEDSIETIIIRYCSVCGRDSACLFETDIFGKWQRLCSECVKAEKEKEKRRAPARERAGVLALVKAKEMERRIAKIALQKAEEKRERQEAYRQRPEYKARAKARMQRPEIKVRVKEYQQRPEIKARAKARMQRPEVKARAKEYSQRPEIKARAKEYSQRPEHKARAKEYSQRPEIKKRIKKLQKIYRQKVYRQSPEFRFVTNIRIRILRALKGICKSARTLELLGISSKSDPIEFLWQHLEKQFQSGMTRENHGKWHLDHIRPCSSFDLTDPEQQRLCFHYSNLQPLWAGKNLRKNAKWSGQLDFTYKMIKEN